MATLAHMPLLVRNFYQASSTQEFPAIQAERFRSWCAIAGQVALYKTTFDLFPSPNFRPCCFALGVISLGMLITHQLQRRKDGPRGYAYGTFVTAALLGLEVRLSKSSPLQQCWVHFASCFLILTQCEWFRLRAFHSISPKIEALYLPQEDVTDEEHRRRASKGCFRLFLWYLELKTSRILSFLALHDFFVTLLSGLSGSECSHVLVAFGFRIEVEGAGLLLLQLFLMRHVRLFIRTLADRHAARARDEVVDAYVDDGAERVITIYLGFLGSIEIVL